MVRQREIRGARLELQGFVPAPRLAVDSARLPCGHDVAPLISMMDRNPPPMLACPLTPIHAPMPLRTDLFFL